MTTFATCTYRIIGEGQMLKVVGLAVAAFVAIARTSTHAPKKFGRKVAIGYATLVVVASLLSADNNALPYTGDYDTGMARYLRIQKPTKGHPIERLCHDAFVRFNKTVKSQSKTLSEAVMEYRRRYNRNPPPNFDVWFKMAQEDNMLLIDEFDGLMDSLEPFWSLPPGQIRDDIESLRGSHMLWHVSIQNHVVESNDHGWAWTHINTWLSSYQEHLPNMTLMFNSFDEPRVLVPYETMSYIGRRDPDPQSKLKQGIVIANETADVWEDLERQNWWELAQNTCPLGSPSKTKLLDSNDTRSKPPNIRFLKDVQTQTDLCQSTDLPFKHGFFGSPTSLVVIDKPVPIFSEAAPAPFLDILFPSQYYTTRMDGSGYDMSADNPWTEKANTLYWAGSTTGGRSTMQNWNLQHRERFVDLVNESPEKEVQFLEQRASGIWHPYNTRMGNLSEFINVKFSHTTQCDEDACELMNEHFHIGSGDPMTSAYRSKLLFDLDGNGFSGRFWRFLYSKSAVLKQTVFREFIDDWLVPWVHYIPVSLDMTELPELIRYLLQTPEGQEQAEAIGRQGKEWAEKVLRKRDVELIFFRILLEYGRLLDDDRDSLQCCAPS